MPQIQSIYNGNFVVWQRKLAEIVVDLKSDIVNLQKFGLIIAESNFFNSTVERGIYVSIEVASHASPNVWNPVHASLLNDATWTADSNNILPPSSGAWVENKYTFNNGSPVVCRYIRFRITADAAHNPLQTFALKKVVLTNNSDVSLASGASVQVNVLGWQTGKVLKDILEDLLENRLLATTVQDEIIEARTSPKGTWDGAVENYVSPIPRIFTTLKNRLDDLELDAERRLTSRKVVIPVDDILSGATTQSVFTTNIQADAPYRKVIESVDAQDTVDVLVQASPSVGTFEEPLRSVDGVLIYGRVTYGANSAGYAAGSNAKVTLYRSDTNAVFPLPQNLSLKFVVPVETDLWHMHKHDLTRGQFSTAVIQDIGVLNELDKIRNELNAAIVSDSVTQRLMVFGDTSDYYADLVFPSNATNASGWIVLKDGNIATPNVDYTFINNSQIRLDTHDNFTPTEWQISYFTATKATLDEKINEIIAAIANLTIAILNMAENLDEINDALVEDWHVERLQFDYHGNDGFDYFKILTYNVHDVDNSAAIMYKNSASIGAKDTTWVFRQDGVVALHRASMPYDPDGEYSIKYYFQKYEHLVDKIQDMTRTTDRNLIVQNWDKTNPVPPEAASDGVKLIF